MAAVALAAVGGVLLAEAVRRTMPGADDGRLGWIAGGGFFGLMASALARPGPVRFWAMVAAGYATLHFFQADPLPAAVLAHALAAPPGHLARVTGTVVDVPRVSAPSSAFAHGGIDRNFLLRLDTVALDGRSRWDARATVAVHWRDGPDALHAGDRLELTASAANVAPPRNPGEFDRASFLRRRGVRSELSVRGLADGRVVGTGSPWHPLTLARAAHDWMQDQLCLDLRDEPDVCAVVSTMLLGLRDNPDFATLEPMFQRTGTLHYFAIDGLKLGLVAFLLWRALDAAGLTRPWAGLLVLPLLFGYALVTGLGAASARAVLVAAVLVGGEWIERRPRPFNSLGAAAAVLLLFDTNQLFELGFQLSFTVVLAILTLAPPLDRWLRRAFGPGERVPGENPPPWPRRALDFLRRETRVLTAVALAAWLGSTPLVLLDFHVVSPVSPLANVVAFPLAVAVLALGVLSLAGAAISHTWVLWMNNANWLAAKALIAVVRAFDAVPGGSFAVASPDGWHWTPPALEITVLDVGRARAAWVRAGNRDWLFDGARPANYAWQVRPCLQARAVRRLDGLLLTGDDADGLGAWASCRADFSPARVVVPAAAPRTAAGRDTRDGLAAGGTPVGFVRRGDVVPLGPGVDAHVFYPPDDEAGRSTSADRALALRLDAAGWRVWWLAEGSGAAARWLAAHGDEDTLGGAVLITTAPVAPELWRLMNPRLVILRPPSGRYAMADAGEPLVPAGTIRQEDSGAVTLEIYPGRIEASGFVDGRKVVLRRSAR